MLSRSKTSEVCSPRTSWSLLTSVATSGRCRNAPADADVLHRVEEQVRPGLLRQLAAQALDDLVGADLAHVERLERDEHEAAVSLPAAGVREHVLHRRVALHDPHEVRKL